METLQQKQSRFVRLVARLIDQATAFGFELTFGEAYRTPEQAKWNQQAGVGIANSLHTTRLAVDFNLFINGVYQSDSAAFKPLGDYWKTLAPDCCWGGDFKKPDGNHFSIEHNGVK